MAAAFFAGFVDAIAGGGGLIQLPALLILKPDLALVTLLGTNKLSSFIGTSGALARYAKGVKIPWSLVLPAAVMAFVCSVLGANFVMILNPEVLKPIVVGLLLLVFVYSLLRSKLKWKNSKRPDSAAVPMVFGALLGFYDGFFGPGTGGFLIFGFVTLMGMNYLLASASSKVVNWATNLAALLAFGFAGHLDYRLGLSMGAFNLLGGLAGSSVAIKTGDRFVERIFQIVILLVIAKLIWDFQR